jgi:hypothetical protein
LLTKNFFKEHIANQYSEQIDQTIIIDSVFILVGLFILCQLFKNPLAQKNHIINSNMLFCNVSFVIVILLKNEDIALFITKIIVTNEQINYDKKAVPQYVLMLTNNMNHQA